MANPIVNVINRLKTDATLVGTLGPTGYSGILQGGVWDRPLRRDPGPGQTVDAFYEAGVRGRMIRPSIVVVDRGDAPHPQEEAIYTAYRQDCYVYFYAPATTSGKNSIYAAQGRVKQLLTTGGSKPTTVRGRASTTWGDWGCMIMRSSSGR